jgi:RHS repeat-associated protein
VLYTHGPGIDAPLALVRMLYSDSLPRPQLVVMHSDWRGEYDMGSYAFNSLTPPCKTMTRSSQFQTYTSDGSETEFPKTNSTISDVTWRHCLEIEWPAPHVWINRQTRNRSLTGPVGWAGTLIDGMRDNSGQMYMRNRYYDPASGRFTQEDPIGLAGGLNAYGYANGDPASYDDPFGLKPCAEKNPGWVARRICRMRADGVAYKASLSEGGISRIVYQIYKENVEKHPGQQRVLIGIVPLPSTLLGAAESAAAGDALVSAEPMGSALKADQYHNAATFMREEAATSGSHFNLVGRDGRTRVLTQLEGELNGQAGRFEYIVDGNKLTHQLFVRGGTINGIPTVP